MASSNTVKMLLMMRVIKKFPNGNEPIKEMLVIDVDTLLL
jgi:hypothetical protein